MNVLLVANLGVAAIICTVLPVMAGLLIARRCHVSWRYWFLGAGVFLLFQVLTRIPAMAWLQTRPSVQKALNDPILLTVFLFVAALTAGLFEEGGRWLALRFAVKPPQRTVATALMLGAGHGGLECMFVALIQVSTLLSYLVIHLLSVDQYPELADAFAQARRQFATLSGWEPLLGAWERLWALLLQIALSLMVLRAFTIHSQWWFAALAVHTFVDFTTAGLLRLLSFLLPRAAAMVATECVVAVYGVGALSFVIANVRSEPPRSEPSAQPP